MTAHEAMVEIDSVAAGGDGVGRTEGMVVFVPRSAPGDLARVRLGKAKRFARGQLLGLERPSPSRVDPPCPHYTA
ncbi:MAG TPA: TRAM domain-containing protein, partial [Gemmatimonadaceae bacterium]|nr:TRAM domain-containing protein [Gemmatimonadaceae bacterium]